ncbi:MAG: hypothetical protein H6661_08610 [Ardenticatenaceae bacterium]|nr:hypothetical protein [Ardenticatenaceae bacterium]
MNEVEIKKLMEILATLKANGVTIIYITHKLNEFFGIIGQRNRLARWLENGNNPADSRNSSEEEAGLVWWAAR